MLQLKAVIANAFAAIGDDFAGAKAAFGSTPVEEDADKATVFAIVLAGAKNLNDFPADIPAD